MKRLLPYFFSAGLVLLSLASFAQTDSTAVGKKPDSLKLPVHSGLQLQLDYGKIITLFTDFESKFEMGIAYQLNNRFSPNAQFGFSTLSPGPAFENGDYTSEGTYGRIGLNYTLPFDPTNLFYVGLKYGFSSYSEEGTYTITTDIWPDVVEAFDNPDLSATWYEVIIGSEKKMGDGHWRMGGSFALRILGSHDELTPIDTFSIPGYGRALDNTTPVFNLYVKYAFF